MGAAVGDPAAVAAACHCKQDSSSSTSSSSTSSSGCYENSGSSSSSSYPDYFALPSLAELEAATCCSSDDCSEEERDALIVQKMKNLFSIKQHGGEEAARVLLKALDYEPHSVLFRHEAAYVLGQLGCSSTQGRLEQLLRDTSEDEMVRHEAAEALGALALPEAREVLEEVLQDECTPETVQQTCQLALDVIKRRTAAAAAEEAEASPGTCHERRKGGEEEGEMRGGEREERGKGAEKGEHLKREEAEEEALPPLRPEGTSGATGQTAAAAAPQAAAKAGGGDAAAAEEEEKEEKEGERSTTAERHVQRNFKDEQFNTVDPSEPYPNCSEKDVGWLLQDLLDSQKTLWTRYRALFTLRNLNSPAAIAALATALARDTSSALLRHEIAFVLGQLRVVPPAAASAAAAPSASPAVPPLPPAAPAAHHLPGVVADASPRVATAATGSAQTPPATPSATATAAADGSHCGASSSASLSADGDAAASAAAPFLAASSATAKNEPAQVAALALLQCLANKAEHPMARHEAALALGSLGACEHASAVLYSETQTLQQAVFESLERYSRDENRVVKESCLVALDTMREEIALESHGR